jgi:hypothetical protein
MASDEKKSTLAARERVQRAFKLILGHIVVERTFRVAHGVLAESAAALCKRTVQELLCVSAQGPMEDHGKPRLKLVFLSSYKTPLVVLKKRLPKGWQVAQ